MRAAGASMQVLGLVLVTLVIFPVGGCQSAARQRRQLASGNPLEEAAAAVALAERGDLAAVHRLVYLLDDDDDAVRMFAILALERLCGQTYGYKFYAPDSERAEAIRRWQEALRRGEVVIHPAPAHPPEDAGQPERQALSDEATAQRSADNERVP